jgi:hypothetical protein
MSHYYGYYKKYKAYVLIVVLKPRKVSSFFQHVKNEEHRPAGIKSSRYFGSVTQPQDAKLVINWVWSAQNNLQKVQNLFTLSHNMSQH